MARTRKPLLISIGIFGSLCGLLIFTLGSCKAMGTLSLFEQRVPQLLQVIDLPDEAGTRQIAVIPGGYAYILNRSGSIAVLDGPKLVKKIDLTKDAKSLTGGIVYNPISDLVYVSDQNNRYVHVIRGTEVITKMSTSMFVPTALTTMSTSELVYLGGVPHPNAENPLPKGISVISNTTFITHINTELTPQSLAVDNRTDRLYVGLSLPADSDVDLLVALIEDGKVVTTSDIGADVAESGAVYALAVNEQTGAVYLKQDLGTVIYWDGEQLERVELGKMGHNPINDFIVVDPTRDLAYVGIQSYPPSKLIALHQGKIVEILYVDFDPQFALYDKTHDYLYATNYRSRTMTVIRGTQIITTVETGGSGPQYIGIDEERGYIYVSNADSHSVAVFGFEEEAPSLWEQFFPFLVK